jgi:glycosyltransferase involved in cell wall biosynthesis
MNRRPDISVVMSVYNGARDLSKTVDSVLSQKGADFEFIVVNDGSTDQTPQILERYARQDSRVRVLHERNQGLTVSLIKGCAEARGKYIARQDAGDQSLPGRLVKQLEFIESQHGASFASCSTRYVGPKGEPLYEVVRQAQGATEDLLTLHLDKVRGPSSHPSTIFYRDLYERVGGYRADFYFAQDLDLWIRLAERGAHAVMTDILYEAAIAVNSLSGRFRKEQIRTAGLILESARLRRSDLSDKGVLQAARRIRPSGLGGVSRLGRAKSLYFIGMCLRKSQNPQASSYFKESLSVYPLHVKSAVRLLLG